MLANRCHAALNEAAMLTPMLGSQSAAQNLDASEAQALARTQLLGISLEQQTGP